MRVFFAGLLKLLLAAVVGGAVFGALNNGREDAVVGGAALLALVLLAYWMLRALWRRLFRGRAGGRKAQLATIVDFSYEAPPGAPWYHHFHVLFDVRGRRHKLKLTPAQAKHFSGNFAVGDTGHLAWSGKRLIEFVPPTAEAPLPAGDATAARRRVFVSYAHGDDPGGQVAEYLQQVFASYGLDTWVDKAQLAPGDSLRDEIRRQIADADFFVPVLTAAYMSSPWCLNEFEVAAGSGVKIIPVKTAPGRLVAPPDMQRLFDEVAGEPLYLDLTARGYLNELRDMAARMAA